jgi:hypothetical protein
MLESYVDNAYRTFSEEVAGALTGKEGWALELSNNGNVQLFNAGKCIGWMFSKLQGSNDINVRLAGKGGTVKVIAGGAVAINANVKPAAGGKMITAATGNRSLGIKISPAVASADLDFMEILDAIETAP